MFSRRLQYASLVGEQRFQRWDRGPVDKPSTEESSVMGDQPTVSICSFIDQLFNVAAVSSDAAAVPHPERVLRADQVSPTHPSSSGRPGWSRMLQRTTAWGSLCPGLDVCCTAEKTAGLGNWQDNQYAIKCLNWGKTMPGGFSTRVVYRGQNFSSCGSCLGEWVYG